MYLRSKLNTVGECRPQRHVHRTKAFQDASAKPPGPTDAPFRNRPALTSLRLGSLLSATARPEWRKAQTRPLPLDLGSAASLLPSLLYMLHFGNVPLSIAHFQSK